ncbi:MAG: hypothetical protein WBX02_09160 [Terriglobales bacterium]
MVSVILFVLLSGEKPHSKLCGCGSVKRCGPKIKFNLNLQSVTPIRSVQRRDVFRDR